MPHRSPARFLAPLALLAAALAIFLVARSDVDALSGSSSSQTTQTPTTTANASRPSTTRKRRTTTTGTTGRRRSARTYTVKPGDVLGSIAASTGVPVADLLEYNDIDDAQSLSVGQKLKLVP